MRILFMTLLASAVFLSSSDPAEARRGGGGSKEQLFFVADTKIEIEGTKYSLCHLTKTHTVMFINLFRSLKTYALASNKCDTEEYIGLTADDLTDAKDAGLIDASVPDTPKLSIGQIIGGSWGIGALGLIGVFFALGFIKSRKRRSAREALMGKVPPAAMAILDAMCHAAKADGTIDASEVVEIMSAAQKMTGENFDAKRVMEMAQLADKDLADSGFKRLVSGRSGDENEIMMRGVLHVVAADGRLDGKEQEFVGKLAHAMQMSSDKVNQLLGEVVGTMKGNAG